MGVLAFSRRAFDGFGGRVEADDTVHGVQLSRFVCCAIFQPGQCFVEPNRLLGQDLARRTRFVVTGGCSFGMESVGSGLVTIGLTARLDTCLDDFGLGQSSIGHALGKYKSHGCESKRYDGSGSIYSPRRSSRSHFGEVGVCDAHGASYFGSKSFRSHSNRSRSN